MNTDQDVEILIWAESLLTDSVLLWSTHDEVRRPPQLCPSLGRSRCGMAVTCTEILDSWKTRSNFVALPPMYTYVPVSSINTAHFLSPTAFRTSRPIAGHQFSGGYAVEVADFTPFIDSFVSVFSRLFTFLEAGCFEQCLLQKVPRWKILRPSLRLHPTLS